MEGTEYSVPNRLVGTKVNFKKTTNAIEVYSNGKPVALHERVFDDRPRVTDVTHMPPNHVSMVSYKRSSVLEEARRLGPIVSEFVKKHIDTHNNVKASGDMTKNIAKKMHQHGRELVEQAITHAEKRGQISAEAVYRILERGIPAIAQTALAKPASPSGNIRGPHYYSDGEAN
ncbi:hypothetical protein AN476_22255 [Phaeobacter sp. 11ANDIMAR09]|nr:hypothetical protein AN476_22255 [Phaeobacter sp. 11ANDIMAR09]